MIQLYNSRALREEIGEKTAEMQALIDLAKAEDREPNDDEQKEFDRLLALVGEPAGGDKPASGLYALVERAEKFEALKNRTQQVQPAPGIVASATPSGGDSEPKRTPAVPKGHGRLKAFTGDDAGAKAYACGRWWMATFRGRDEDLQWVADYGAQYGIDGIRAAHTEGTNSAGGFTVPDPLSSTLIDVVERYGVMRPYCRVIPMTSDTLAVPKRTAGLTVDYPGENTAITDSDLTFAQVSLTAVKRSVMTYVSRELSEDTVVALMDQIAMEVGRAFGLQEDAEILVGDGSGTYGGETGITEALHANAKTTMGSGDTAFSNIAITDLHDVRASLPEKYHPMARWVMRRDTWHEFIIPLLLAANGASVAAYTSGQPAQLFGYPVVFSDSMPASGASKCAALFGSISDTVLIGQRSVYTMETSEHFKFSQDALTIKAGRRYDVNVHSIGTAATDRATVGLYTAAS